MLNDRLLYVGGGIINSGADESLRAFAEAFQLPVAPTLMGLGGFQSGHPALAWNVGDARHIRGEYGACRRVIS